MRTWGRTSRIMDGMGIALVAGTAWLYAHSAGSGESLPACSACEDVRTVPAAPPDEAPQKEDSITSVAQEFCTDALSVRGAAAS